MCVLKHTPGLKWMEGRGIGPYNSGHRLAWAISSGEASLRARAYFRALALIAYTSERIAAKNAKIAGNYGYLPADYPFFKEGWLYLPSAVPDW